MSLYDVSPSSTTRSNHFSHRSSICLSDIRIMSPKKTSGRKKCKKHVTFSEDLLMIIYIESFKKYNFLNTAGEPDDVKCKCLVF